MRKAGVVGPSATASEIVQLSMGGICAAHFQLPGGAIGFDKMDQGYAGSPARLAREYPTGRS
jgi:hypothetical protein